MTFGLVILHTAIISYGTYANLNIFAEKYPSLIITYDEIGPARTHQFVMRTLSGEYVNDTATRIGSYAFDGTSVTSVSCPNVTEIASSAFYYNLGIKNINFPKVQTIGGNAFCQAQKLTGDINMPEVTSIGGSAFMWTKITSINLPKVTVIESSTFSSCSQLTHAMLPNVTTIKTSGFNGCTALTKVDLSMVTYLSDQAFRACSALQAVIIRSATLCTMQYQSVFQESSIKSGTGYIYVPSALVDSYKAATNWSVFAAQIRAIEDYPDICGGG